MERGSIVKWLFLGLAVFLVMQFGMPIFFGNKAGDKQPLGQIRDHEAAPAHVPENGADPTGDDSAIEKCPIDGPRFKAQIGKRSSSLRHLTFTESKYERYQDHNGFFSRLSGDIHPRKSIDLATTWKEPRLSLRTNLKPGGDTPHPGPSGDTPPPGAPGDAAGRQVAYDDLDWVFLSGDGKSCTFEYRDDSTAITKIIAATERPFELSVTITVENLASEPRMHRMTIEQTDYLTKKDTEGSLGRMSEQMTETVVHTTAGKTERHGTGDFDPDDFKDKEFTAELWRRTPGEAAWVATDATFFTKVLVAVDGPSKPFGETQIEEIYTGPDKTKDPHFGHVYRSRLAYPDQKLEPKQSVTYRTLSFTGPKERSVLAAVGGGAHPIAEVINLGWFAPIGKILIAYVYALHRLVGSWGWAICLLTISVKLLLFPLSWAQIKSSIGMRKLKPEMDALNAKYKDDATQRGIALQELWRKNKVGNPVTGCVPVLLQMPVWFALYTSLQTAVELYNTPFGPFIPDLSAPGKYFIIPIVLGASSFFQQKIMPPQGDPAQQKMMMYMMPGIFTVMMLFLPAGLGVYMLTNTWLGITQQILMERYHKAKAGGGDGGIEVREKKSGNDGGGDGGKDGPLRASPLLETGGRPLGGKGKARVRG